MKPRNVPVRGRDRDAAEHETQEGSDSDGMATFLQFCATCENQIPVSSGSALYCSDSCRKQDREKAIRSHANTNNPSPPLTPYSTREYDIDRYFPRDIVPQARPTGVPFHQSARSPPSHDDPACYYPISSPVTVTQSFSAAANSLHRYQPTSTTTQFAPASLSHAPSKRSRAHERNPSLPNLAALSITPITTSYTSASYYHQNPTSASSRTSAGAASSRYSRPRASPITPASYSTTPTSATTTAPYYFDQTSPSSAMGKSSRPLPPRTLHAYSTSTPRSVDLVIPTTLAAGFGDASD